MSPQRIALLVQALEGSTPSVLPVVEVPSALWQDRRDPDRTRARRWFCVKKRARELYELSRCGRLLPDQDAALSGEQTLELIAAELRAVPIGDDEDNKCEPLTQREVV